MDRLDAERLHTRIASVMIAGIAAAALEVIRGGEVREKMLALTHGSGGARPAFRRAQAGPGRGRA